MGLFGAQQPGRPQLGAEQPLQACHLVPRSNDQLHEPDLTSQGACQRHQVALPGGPRDQQRALHGDRVETMVIGMLDAEQSPLPQGALSDLAA